MKNEERISQLEAELEAKNNVIESLKQELNYIHEHYNTKILQEDIAQQLQISVRYLSKLFKSYMGVTLSNYINIYRINRSIQLMQTTSLTLTEIALQVGFTDSQHYSKVFMNIINEAPSQYRKAI